MNMPELLYDAPMLDLLHDQIEQSDTLHREYLAASDGQWNEVPFDLVRGGPAQPGEPAYWLTGVTQ